MSACPRVEGVRLLWIADYWDGPLSGMAHHDGRDCWFEIEPFEGEEWPPATERRYRLYPLSNAEAADEHDVQQRFRAHVSTYGDFTTSAAPRTAPRSEWSTFYDWYEKRPPRPYASRQPVGWFMLDYGESAK